MHSKVVSVNLYDYIDIFDGMLVIPPRGEVTAEFYLPSRFFEHRRTWLYGGVVFLVEVISEGVALLEGYVNNQCLGGLWVTKRRNFYYYDLPTPPLKRKSKNTLVLKNRSGKKINIGRVDIWIAVRKWI